MSMSICANNLDAFLISTYMVLLFVKEISFIDIIPRDVQSEILLQFIISCRLWHTSRERMENGSSYMCNLQAEPCEVDPWVVLEMWSLNTPLAYLLSDFQTHLSPYCLKRVSQRIHTNIHGEHVSISPVLGSVRRTALIPFPLRRIRITRPEIWSCKWSNKLHLRAMLVFVCIFASNVVSKWICDFVSQLMFIHKRWKLFKKIIMIRKWYELQPPIHLRVK
jgi:hypothetical protein